jgi:hypothetical protein
VTAAQVRDVIMRIIAAGQWHQPREIAFTCPIRAEVFGVAGTLLSTSYAGGVPFKEITALLGQSSPGETERYVHRLPDQTLAQRARAAIDNAFAASGSPLEAADFADSKADRPADRKGLQADSRHHKTRSDACKRVRRQGLEPRTRG